MSTESATAYINAGGRGTRLGSVLPADAATGIAKALIPVGVRREPIIAYHIRRCIGLGFRNVVVGCGDHENVAQYVDDTFGAYRHVTPLLSTPQLGTGGDLFQAMRRAPEQFCDTTVVANCDTLLDIDERRLVAEHKRMETDATLVVTTMPDVPNAGAFLVGPDGRVLRNDEAAGAPADPLEVPIDAYTASSCGMVALRTAAMLEAGYNGDFSIYSHYLGDVSVRGALGAFNNGANFFMDIGVPSTYSYVQDNPDVIDGLLGVALTATHVA